MKKQYLIQCSCGYKRWSNGQDVDDLTMVSTCKDCGGAKKFKCPKCGYLVKAKKFIQPPDPKNNKFKLH